MPWSLDNHMMHSRLVCVHNYPKLDETLITLHKFERGFELVVSQESFCTIFDEHYDNQQLMNVYIIRSYPLRSLSPDV